MWKELYDCYKKDFDLEKLLSYYKMTYADLEKEETIDDLFPM